MISDSDKDFLAKTAGRYAQRTKRGRTSVAFGVLQIVAASAGVFYIGGKVFRVYPKLGESEAVFEITFMAGVAISAAVSWLLIEGIERVKSGLRLLRDPVDERLLSELSRRVNGE